MLELDSKPQIMFEGPAKEKRDVTSILKLFNEFNKPPAD